MLYTEKIFLNSGRTAHIELDSNDNLTFSDASHTSTLV